MAGAASESTPSSPRVSLPMNIGDACVAAVAAQEEKSASTSTEHEVLEEDEAIYNKFSKSVKRRVLIITASSELALECSVFAFLPSIKPIADELNTTPSVINLTISLFVIALGIAPLFWSNYSVIYGKRPVYLIANPLYAIGSMGIALSHNLAGVMVCRVIQGIGASCMIVVGTASVGDVYHPRERGGAMAWYLFGTLMGPVLAPVLAGALQEYIPNDYGWHAMQWLMAGCGLACTIAVYFGLPETAHSKLIDVKKDEIETQTGHRPKFLWVWGNPFTALSLLRRPNVFIMGLICGFSLATHYMVTTPMTTILAPRYNIDNALLQGCLYLPLALGNILGTLVSGPLSNQAYHKGLSKRGKAVPEDRLKAAYPNAFLIMPLSLFGLGLCIHFYRGVGGIVVACILICLTSFGLMGILAITYAYLADCLKERSPEGVAAATATRYMICAAASGFVLPMNNAITAAGANAFAAGLSWITGLLLLILVVYGHRLRKDKTASGT